MKYIKRFESAISPENVENEILKYLEDIFRELEDVGFILSIDKHKDTPYSGYKFKVSVNYNKNKPFKYGVIKDCVESASDYMESVGYKVYSKDEWVKSGKFGRFSDIGWDMSDDYRIEDEFRIHYRKIFK
jgi:hypothetical protein